MRNLVALIFLFFLMLFNLSAAGQNDKNFVVSSLGDTVFISPIAVVEVNSSIEKLTAKLNELSKKTESTPEVVRIDTVLRKANELLIREKERLAFEQESLNIRTLDDLTTQWSDYDEILNNWQTTIKNRLNELEGLNFELRTIQRTWELTKEQASEKQAPPATITRISEVIASLNEIINLIKRRKDEILVFQSQVTDFQIDVNKVLERLGDLRKKIQSTIFSYRSLSSYSVD